MVSALQSRVALFVTFTIFIGIALLSLDSKNEERRRLSSSNQLLGQGTLLVNSRQKVGRCSGVQLHLRRLYDVRTKGDTFTKNDLYLKVSPKPEGTDSTKVKWRAGSSKKLNHKFCWASKVSKVSFAVMDKDWIGSDDKLDDIVFNIERNGKQTASGAKGSKVDLVVSGFVKEAEKEEEKQEEPEEEKQEEPKEENALQPFYWACTAANKGQPYDRIRKDYNDLTVAERKLYIKAVKEAKAAGKYDMFVALHKFANNDVYAHSSGGFYPWHRKFLLEFENMLRSLKEEYKCVTIPFWDWAQESKVCELINNGLADEHEDDAKLRTNKDVRCNEFSDTGFILKDFGGKGTRDEITEQAFVDATGRGYSGCVSKSGPFGDWTDFEDRKCLARGTYWKYDRNGKTRMPLRTALASELKRSNNYKDFFVATYGRIHGTPHVNVGGHMARMWSPQDPLFFSHHAFVDKLWYNHQDCHDHKNKDAAMWQEVITDRYRIPTSKNQELPFCMPKRFAKMTWAKQDFQTFLSNTSPKNTEWCGSKPKSRYRYLKSDNIQFSSDALSSWTDNYRLGDWVDSHNLPGKGNNVMYWPDEFDRLVAKETNADGLCSLTMAQRKTAETAKAALALLETKEMTHERAVLEHHASIDAPGGWKRLRKEFKKGMERHNRAIKNLNMLRQKIFDILKNGVTRDLQALKKGGIDAAVESECKDANQWDNINEESQPMKVFGHWFPQSKLQVAKMCFEKPSECPLLGPCKKLRLKLKKDSAECGALDNDKIKCIKKKKCVWLRNTKVAGEGKCV